LWKKIWFHGMIKVLLGIEFLFQPKGGTNSQEIQFHGFIKYHQWHFFQFTFYHKLCKTFEVLKRPTVFTLITSGEKQNVIQFRSFEN
jgi:hypothetical protein